MNFKKEVIESQNTLNIISVDRESIITKAKFGPSKETRIPIILSEELAFLVATIIGDGHLKKEKFQIMIELSNKELLKTIQGVCKKLFNRDFNINKVKKRNGKKQTHYIVMDSKSIYLLLNKVFKIPIGKKSHIVYIPETILESENSIKSAFLIGIMLTEGGKRRRGLGLSTASRRLWAELIMLFNEIGIKVLPDKWEYKKYKKMYYGLSFKRECLPLIMRGCQSGQMGQILFILKKILED